MSRIFISYRRSDASAEAGRIYDYLENKFGGDAIFKDVDAIDAGDDFRDRIHEAVGQCQILLAVIGKNWLWAKDEAGRRRLDNPADWVRLEIETALQRKIRVIPVLLDGVVMPTSDDLPEALQPLAYRKAARVRHDPDFRTDIGRVLDVIQRHLDGLPVSVAAPRSLFQSFTENLGGNVTLEMIAIPGGAFAMGSPASEPDRSKAEGPQHDVTVPSLWMGKYAVTQAQWRAVAALPKVARDLNGLPAHFLGNNRPVERVSWHAAVEFCQRLTRQAKREYRLPSEAEWEYACRAGTTTPFCFGETITDGLVNYNATQTYNSSPKGKYRRETIDAGSFPANAFGLYDMHGNVYEWCTDHWHSSYDDCSPTDGSAWLTDDLEAPRLIRGGSWGDFPRTCRSAFRRDHASDGRYFIVGFRVSCSAPRTLA